MLYIVASFRHHNSARERASALADVLTSPALGALKRTWYVVKDRDKGYTAATSEAVVVHLTNPEAHAVGLDSGRGGDLVATAMFDVALPYTPDAGIVPQLTSYAVVPYEAGAAGSLVDAFVSIAEILRPIWGMIAVEPDFGVAHKAALESGPPKDRRTRFPHITDERIRYRLAPWFYRAQIDEGIGGPEWGTFLGPKHLEKLPLDKLRASGAFARVRDLSYGGALLQLSDDPADAAGERIIELVSKGRSALGPVLLDVDVIPLSGGVY